MTNEEFVHEIYALSYRRLVGQLFVVCGELPTAEDVVQEAFVRAVAQGSAFRKLDIRKRGSTASRLTSTTVVGDGSSATSVFNTSWRPPSQPSTSPPTTWPWSLP